MKKHDNTDLHLAIWCFVMGANDAILATTHSTNWGQTLLFLIAVIQMAVFWAFIDRWKSVRRSNRRVTEEQIDENLDYEFPERRKGRKSRKIVEIEIEKSDDPKFNSLFNAVFSGPKLDSRMAPPLPDPPPKRYIRKDAKLKGDKS